MNAEKTIHAYYEQKIHDVRVPSVPEFTAESPAYTTAGRIAGLICAAVLAVSIIPFFHYSDHPSELARKASEFSRRYELSTKIPAGIMELKEITNFPSVLGGKK